MGEKYQALLHHLMEIRNVNRAEALLGWDQQVNMPPGGSKGRAAQVATLARIGHEMLTDEKTDMLLKEAQLELGDVAYDSDEASMIRVTRVDYHENTCIPSDLIAEHAEATALGHNIWKEARAKNDFAAFAPILTRILDLTRRMADYIGYQEHPYDALLGQYERGMKSSEVKRLFDEHKPPLVKLIAQINERADRVSDDVLHRDFPLDRQRQFCTDIASAIGYDFNRGRIDVATHPFAITFNQGDVRITTRYYQNFISPAIFGTMHESGHAMYEQGVSPTLEGTPLSRGASLGVHESQSRMWENFVGRSKGFWTWAYPQLQATFPESLGDVSVDAFYRAINKVGQSFIRVEADEATYNLHIMLRFELEMEMVAGNIPVEKLPDEWNQRFEAYFGIVPPTDTLGVLQDVHWSSGLIGYFATYALGNMLAAQYWQQALRTHPEIPAEIERGKFDTLLKWLNVNIHQHGRKFTPAELTKRITGESIKSSEYMKYLEAKYGEIYGL
ncbi:MAG: carboxypeptidase M32 [Chloroflexi bacterium]|nr:carboxypeptidase M32 [Chloroflexota bacterium]